jgi:Ca2+-binding EF-hand superfamily protein
MREGLGGFHRAAFLSSILALAFAAPAIAEDSKEGGNRPARIFQKSDTDGDGRLSKEERAAARDKHQKEHLQEFDADGDGKLSDTERSAANKQRYSRHIEQFDTDGDGTLSEEERQAAREKRSGRKDQELERFDADGDGKLTGA